MSAFKNYNFDQIVENNDFCDHFVSWEGLMSDLFDFAVNNPYVKKSVRDGGTAGRVGRMIIRYSPKRNPFVNSTEMEEFADKVIKYLKKDVK
jgi:hypothetical protein